MDKMLNEDKIKTTIRVDREIWKEAKIKSKCGISHLIEELLINYIRNDAHILAYEEKIDECREKIEIEKTKIKQYKHSIKELEAKMEANGKNAIIIGECVETMKRYNRQHGFITVQFLKRLSKVKMVHFDKLNDICLGLGYEIKNIDLERK